MRLAIAVAVLAVAACLCALILTVRATVAAVPGEIAVTRSRLIEQVRALRLDAAQQITAAVDVADQRLASIQTDASARTSEALGIVRTTAAGVGPVLTNAASLTKDAQDSLDDLYPDIRGTVESGAVAVTSVAQASEAIRDAAPQLAASVVGIGKSVDGMAADGHQLTQDIVKPQTKWQKFKAVMEALGKIGARLL